MRNCFLGSVVVFSLMVFSFTGCGSGDSKVIEAPATTEDLSAAPPEMSDEDYAKEMEKSMSQ